MKRFANKNPVVFSLLVTIVLLILMVGAFIIGALLTDIPYGKDMGESLGKVLASIVFIVVLWRLNWLKGSGVTNSGDWKRWLIISVLLIYAVLSTIYALTGSIDVPFSDPQRIFWITANMMGSGLVEEIVYRGLVFYCLMIAWTQKTNGILLSGIVSAAIFGYSHLFWVLLGKDLTLGFLQSTAAFCSGIFYAGVVIQTRTIWPVVVIHGLTNTFAYIKISQIPEFTETIQGGFMDVLYSLPLVAYGLFFLWKNSKKDADCKRING